ncbi:MAG TPA: hypothetical protein VJ761_01280 [Ktedonobacteraceae bacterium]|nr:hypothetical protein [Ktedonobacteraceae bacterium]
MFHDMAGSSSAGASHPLKRSLRRPIVLVGIAVLVVVLAGGIVWLALPHAGSISEFPIPTAHSVPRGFAIAAGPDGNLWFTEQNGHKIGRITPNGKLSEFALPTTCQFACQPTSITAGPDGSLWFTTDNGYLGQIGRITPSGSITMFPPPNGDAFGIAAGPDGSLWFTEPLGNKIGRITPSGSIREFPIPTPNSAPYGITAGPDGNLWFAEGQGNNIGRISPRS